MWNDFSNIQRNMHHNWKFSYTEIREQCYILYENNSYGIDNAYAYRKIIDLALLQCMGLGSSLSEIILATCSEKVFWTSS
jgi:hypothetical protein